ncbi:MAG TPA: hypothetical protein VGD49_06265 [Longimicrobiales bacterium]
MTIARTSLIASVLMLLTAAARLLAPIDMRAFSAATRAEASSDLPRPTANAVMTSSRTPHTPSMRNPFVRESDLVPTAPVPPPVPQPHRMIPPMQMLGTIKYADGAFSAVLQDAGGEAKLLRVGQAIGPFTIKSIRRGQVKLVGMDTTITLKMMTQ